MVVRSPVRSPVRNVVQSVFGAAEAFNPFQLFTSGAQGAWYDPSDLSTLYQDAAGTTPVTAVEQPVGLMLDRSRGLVLGSELVTNGTFDTDTTGWSNTPTFAAVTFLELDK